MAFKMMGKKNNDLKLKKMGIYSMPTSHEFQCAEM